MTLMREDGLVLVKIVNIGQLKIPPLPLLYLHSNSFLNCSNVSNLFCSLDGEYYVSYICHLTQFALIAYPNRDPRNFSLHSFEHRPTLSSQSITEFEWEFQLTCNNNVKGYFTEAYGITNRNECMLTKYYKFD
jgi:hypothetical protein